MRALRSWRLGLLPLVLFVGCASAEGESVTVSRNGLTAESRDTADGIVSTLRDGDSRVLARLEYTEGSEAAAVTFAETAESLSIDVRMLQTVTLRTASEML